jgi:hypothetical protein
VLIGSSNFLTVPTISELLTDRTGLVEAAVHQGRGAIRD